MKTLVMSISRMKILPLLLMLTLISSCAAPKKESLNLTGKKILMIVAHQDFQDDEYSIPRKIFEDEGANVKAASSLLNEAIGAFGLRINPDFTLAQVNAKRYDAVVLVGGVGAGEYLENETAHSIVEKAYSSKKVVGAICLGPTILANAGILRGKKATVWKGEAKTLKAVGAIYTGRAVEQDGKIITADSPYAAGAFAKAIVNELKK